MKKFTYEQWGKLYELKKELIYISTPLGPLHSSWDYVSDIDRLVNYNKLRDCYKTVGKFIEDIERQIQKQKESK